MWGDDLNQKEVQQNFKKNIDVDALIYDRYWKEKGQAKVIRIRNSGLGWRRNERTYSWWRNSPKRPSSLHLPPPLQLPPEAHDAGCLKWPLSLIKIKSNYANSNLFLKKNHGIRLVPWSLAIVSFTLVLYWIFIWNLHNVHYFFLQIIILIFQKKDEVCDLPQFPDRRKSPRRSNSYSQSWDSSCTAFQIHATLAQLPLVCKLYLNF